MLRRLQKKHSNYDVIRWHKEENDRKKLLVNIKTYREEDVRKQQMRMDMTLAGGKSINDSLWGGSSANSNYGGGGSYRTNPVFFKGRGVATAGQESFRFHKQSVESRGQFPKFKKPNQSPNTSRSRTVDPSAR